MRVYVPVVPKTRPKEAPDNPSLSLVRPLFEVGGGIVGLYENRLGPLLAVMRDLHGLVGVIDPEAWGIWSLARGAYPN